jgi:hypothetical protein
MSRTPVVLSTRRPRVVNGSGLHPIIEGQLHGIDPLHPKKKGTMRIASQVVNVGAAAALLGCLVCGAARADGLGDLKAALSRLQGQAPVHAALEVSAHRQKGRALVPSAKDPAGSVSIGLEEGERGLQVQLSPDVLARLATEKRNKERDPKATTPIREALKEVNAPQLRQLLGAAVALSNAIEQATFKAEKAVVFNDKPARVLSFETPMELRQESERKYIKTFQGSLEIWIAADGTPLASLAKQTSNGRAFVFVSFELSSHDALKYAVVGERLVTLHKEHRYTSSGMGKEGDSEFVITDLKLL